GEKTDGHLYLAKAVAASTPLVIIHDEAAAGPEIRSACGVLLVTDTVTALMKLAAAYRRQLDGTRVIAVGGSNGKTTTVRLIDAVLSTELKGTASKKSFNNNIGVPLTILGAKRGDQYLICEVGTNAPGEIAPLTDAVRPDIAVLTSIGREHLEGLGSIEGVIREELSLLAGLKPGGLAVLPVDVPDLRAALRRSGPMLATTKTLWFGTGSEADLRVSNVRTSIEGTTFTLNERESITVSLPGVHNATNAAAAVAVARRLGISDGAIVAGLAGAKGPPMRMERSEVGGVTFINDAYNANPDSMLRSLDTFFAIAAEAGALRAVLVLGDMLELGGQAAALHREVLRAAHGHVVRSPVPVQTVLVGSLMAEAATELSDAPVMRLAKTDGQGASAAAEMLNPGDCVLLKGSRGTAVDRVLEAFRERIGRTEPAAT
ncbi:MAG: UDP-N-acetylmuramoyl-tripeptide--D-alanyl-D-alanine ligase, partial [bacterium]|nr:UDP-N-acetylmuramoyl-tripeptide--D-alanyl-D-alanine ligase [bacterium]